MPVEDAEMTRKIRSEISRRYVDATLLEVHCVHGTVYMRGVLSKLRTHPDVDLKHEIEIITHHLRQKSGVRDVIWEAVVRG